MTSPLTSDLFGLADRVGPEGLVIGIDPDPWNHEQALRHSRERGYGNIRLVQIATFSEPGSATFVFGKQSSWNQLGNIELDETAEFSGRQEEVRLDTLDHILEEEGVDPQRVGHVNLTNNGAEYHSLLGFKNGLGRNPDIALSLIAGRRDASGTIDGKPDHELILTLLESQGFRTRFRRINQLFWWGFVVKLLINRRWIYGRPNYGVIFAAKGRKRIPWYQSFS